jgi:hypothetical protein
MKKLIDIPDEIVKELKHMAINNDTNLKNYIEKLISRHYELSNITEMASIGIDDGQSVRFIWNYLLETYNGIENEVFDFGDVKFEKCEDFILHVKEVCEEMLFTLKNNENE